MRIGILTFHNANNYGALLQAYGLQKVILSLGHHVECIDYLNPTIEARKDSLSLKHNSFLRVIKRYLLNYRDIKRRQCVFDEFRKTYLLISTRQHPNTISKSNYDILVVGSDQVWNPILTGGLDPVYWGEFSGNIPTITYAASSYDPREYTIAQVGCISNYVRNFSAIGVREFRLQNFFSANFNIQSTVVLDPTLLAGRSVFENIICERLVHKPYLLVYCVESQTQDLKEIAWKIARDKDLELVVIGSKSSFWQGATVVLPSIPQFLSLFMYADCITSLSFHGTAFSIIFEKEFYSVRGGNMARVETLLTSLGLKNRIVSCCNDIKYDTIDYSIVNERLKILQEDSLDFLINSIK